MGTLIQVMFAEEASEIRMLGELGFDATTLDGYVYCTDGSWHGFYDTVNYGVDMPYVCCTLHNEQTWQAYQDSMIPDSGGEWWENEGGFDGLTNPPVVEDPFGSWWAG